MLLDLFTPLMLFAVALFAWSMGAVGSLILSKHDRAANIWGNSLAILGSIAGLLSSFFVLTSGKPFFFSANSSLPLLSFSFQIDTLSAFFIFVISLIALLCSLYGFGYVKHYYGQYNIGALGFFYNLFLAGMVMVASASNLIFFLVVWEIMSLASYFLVIFEHNKQENIAAGLLYFVMTHIGTAAITLAFLLLYQATGSLDFGGIKENIGVVTPFVKDVVFLLCLIGFGTKAGIIPLHIWLPSAHPAAPSHVSALMSGVMIKTGILMFVKIFFDLMSSAPLWWGVVILILGALSSLLGVLYALTEHDIKKLLAYHSIENIGIILLGLGSALMFRSLNMMPLAMLALTASLFHTLNHAIFKSLLFMGAGSVISAMHTRNMEEYGGLIKYMPATAFFFLIGSMAISALPPFNGFMSEWMTFQSLFVGISEVSGFAQGVFIGAAGALAFTGGLAAMCFVKVFGTTFLARPRSQEVTGARDPAKTSLLGMAILSTLTLMIGLGAGTMIRIISGVVKNLTVFSPFETLASTSFSTVGLKNNTAIVSAPLIFISMVLAMAVVFLLISLISHSRKIKVGRTWDCGRALTPRMEITSTGFARSIITIFQGILKPTKQVAVAYRDENLRYFAKSHTIDLGIENVYQVYFYKPVYGMMIRASDMVKKIQSGNIQMYVMYMLIILLVLLFVTHH